MNRRNIQDNRVHCCLYFVPPYGHGLRQMDIDFLRRLHKKVNVVLVIAKADALTTNELKKLKANILNDLETHKIELYQFPDCDSGAAISHWLVIFSNFHHRHKCIYVHFCVIDEDEEFKQQDRELKASIPFAVVSSNSLVEVGGKKVFKTF